MSNNIIAIVGMCGSGKSVVSDALVEMGYKKVYFGGVTMEKLQEVGLEVNEKNEKMMREKLRKELGMDAYAKVLLPRIKKYFEDGNVVLDGLYSWDELKYLQDNLNKIIVISIVTDKEIRYNRLSQREIRPLSMDDAKNRDIAEIENLAKGGPIAYADYFIFNNKGRDECKAQLFNILDNLGE
ncbi:MAG TPA: AAA family ATPase [Bacilli bacterium]|nr:AAA family ATPase [Bacilli bacterium]